MALIPGLKNACAAGIMSGCIVCWQRENCTTAQLLARLLAASAHDCAAGVMAVARLSCSPGDSGREGYC